jgi:hypothetical protein
MKSMWRAPGTKRYILNYDGLLSIFAFNFNLRRYSTGIPVFHDDQHGTAVVVSARAYTPTHISAQPETFPVTDRLTPPRQSHKKCLR